MFVYIILPNQSVNTTTCRHLHRCDTFPVNSIIEYEMLKYVWNSIEKKHHSIQEIKIKAKKSNWIDIYAGNTTVRVRMYVSMRVQDINKTLFIQINCFVFFFFLVFDYQLNFRRQLNENFQIKYYDARMKGKPVSYRYSFCKI